MKSLLIFIPRELYSEKPGYIFGRVNYDARSGTKKFFAIGIRQIRSDAIVKLRRNSFDSIAGANNDVMGHLSSADDTNVYRDNSYPDWINISLNTCESSSIDSPGYYLRNVFVDSRKIEPSQYHTVLIIYDRLVLMEADLFMDKTPPDHFHELKLILQKKSVEDEIRKKSTFTNTQEVMLTYIMLIFLYPTRMLCKLTNGLLPILKFSALGLHLNAWLENLQWMLDTVMHNKRFNLKAGNYLVAMALDVLLGVLLLKFLLHAIGQMPPSKILLDNAEKVVETLKGLVNWLMGAPAGLKLNHSFNEILGKFFLYHIHLWWTFLVFIKPVLDFAFKVLLLFGRLGVTFQVSIAADLLALVSFHSYCIYIYAARLFNIQLRGLTALFRLFLGKKQNPLRERIDSCEYQPNQLFVGTLLFTILLFLMPTTWVYYAVFTTLRVVMIGLGGFLTRLKFYLQIMPVYTYSKWLFCSPITSSSVNMRMHPTQIKDATTIVVSMTVSPWCDTWKHCIPDTIHYHPSIEWTTIANNVFSGQLLYPL
ncbi:phosphatidylinositol N-acetylglucosaminyltransferase subunit Q [Cephus cinctus]|uniref:Phosphatidylinositol N-acetylglucosaminyltransferase subunit Q n=1 Tax=Cephus cinctus TaxID=211228 RepID=A0AAJ7FTY8_CEPCN|nr:phosphatidylinositol N-acetylglucosaminyltransferase subunit Q [Cephus cinctus]